MQSRPFAIVMGILCGVLGLVCLMLGTRFWKAWQLHQAAARAVARHNKDEHAEALEQLDKCIELAPDYVGWYRLAALSASKLGKTDEARGYYAAVVERATGDELTSAKLRLGALCLASAGPDAEEDLDQAIAHLEEARKALGEDAEPMELARASGLLGIAHLRKGNDQAALPLLREAVKTSPEDDPLDIDKVIRAWYLSAQVRRGGPAGIKEAWRAYRYVLGTDAAAAETRATTAGLIGIRLARTRRYAEALSYLSIAVATLPVHPRNEDRDAIRLWYLWVLSRQRDFGSLLAAWDKYNAFVRSDAIKPRSDFRDAFALSLAFLVHTDTLTDKERKKCLVVIKALPKDLRDEHAFLLTYLEGLAHERLGGPVDLEAARKAYSRARTLNPQSVDAQRALARVLFVIASRLQNDGQAKLARTREDEAAAAYRALLDSKALSGGERNKLQVTVAALLWHRGKKDEATELLKDLTHDKVPGEYARLLERVLARAALLGLDKHLGEPPDKRDALLRSGHEAVVEHLKRAQAIDKKLGLDAEHSDVAKLLAQLEQPPTIHGPQLNTRFPYDPHPVISLGFASQAVPVPIPTENVKISLDGKPVEAVITKGEAFLKLSEPLAAGEHNIDVAVTDILGLSAKKTLKFTIEKDTEKPEITGLMPEPESQTRDRQPIISFRCSDVSSIKTKSLNVAIVSARAGSKSVIRSGEYRMPVGLIAPDGTETTLKKKQNWHRHSLAKSGVVKFRLPKPLAGGTYTVKVSVSDTRGNSAKKEWSFTCLQ